MRQVIPLTLILESTSRFEIHVSNRDNDSYTGQRDTAEEAIAYADHLMKHLPYYQVDVYETRYAVEGEWTFRAERLVYSTTPTMTVEEFIEQRKGSITGPHKEV